MQPQAEPAPPTQASAAAAARHSVKSAILSRGPAGAATDCAEPAADAPQVRLLLSREL